ncbi:MAG: GNAT family N-acetyltransferase [Tenacibaculum sp.]
MQTLKGININLRALEPEDLAFLYDIENNELFWQISHTETPFSKFLLKQYLKNAHLDIYQTKQLRLIIERIDKQLAVGIIDLFDFNPKHKRAGVGILIHPDHQKNGYASESVDLLINYCFKHLHLNQLYVNIGADNTNSLNLFKKKRFVQVGVKKNWSYNQGVFKDEILFQLLNK